jgi:hypothetical protein
MKTRVGVFFAAFADYLDASGLQAAPRLALRASTTKFASGDPLEEKGQLRQQEDPARRSDRCEKHR